MKNTIARYKKKFSSIFNQLQNLILIFLIVIFIAGCTLYREPQTPSAKSLGIPEKLIKADKTALIKTKLTLPWWKNFNDKKLEEIIILAIRNNPNYQISLKNIAIARTYIAENKSYYLPEIDLNIGASRNSPSQNALTNQNLNILKTYNLFHLNGTVSYEIDFWKKIRNGVNKARANENRSIAASDIAKLTLLSTVIDTHLQIANLNFNIKTLNRQANVAYEMLSLNQNQYQSGLINIESIDNLKIKRNEIKVKIENVKKQKELLEKTLAYLVGKYPENFAYSHLIGNNKEENPDSYAMSKIVAKEIPAHVLTDRPDIKKAFYDMVAHGYAEKENLASLFPTFNLTGTYGFASLKLATITQGGSAIWNFGIDIAAPLLDYGKRFNRYKRAKLQYETAVLIYKDTLLYAFKEVESALASYKHDYLILKTLQNNVFFNEEKMKAAYAQYISGVLDYTTYLAHKFNLLQSQYEATLQNQIVISDIIQVYKSLGMRFWQT